MHEIGANSSLKSKVDLFCANSNSDSNGLSSRAQVELDDDLLLSSFQILLSFGPQTWAHFRPSACIQKLHSPLIINFSLKETNIDSLLFEFGVKVRVRVRSWILDFGCLLMFIGPHSSKAASKSR